MSAPPRETNTRLHLALGLAACAALAAAPARPRPAPAAPGPAVEVLAPRFFPVWQARNVAFPFVLLERPSGRYRMYYAGSGAAQLNESAPDQWATGLATSRDGEHWTFPDDYQPVLPAHRFADGEVVEAARRTRFDAMAAFGACVRREGSRYLMWYTGWNGDDEPEPDSPGRARAIHFRIGHATSSDGQHWTKRDGDAGLGAVLGPGTGPESLSVAQPFVVRDGTGYRMWYEAFDGAWRIASARSADGLAWTREGVAIEGGGARALDELGARNPVVLRRRGGWELWYQGRSRTSPQYHLLRATSADARSWTRAAAEVDLRLQPPLRGEEAVHADSVLVQPDGSCQVFFARERTLRRRAAWGEAVSRSFHLFTVRVDP